MRKLLLAALALIATPALASPSAFALSGWTAQAGQPDRFTITRTGVGGQSVTLKTSDGTAHAGPDYAVTNVTVRFGPYQKSAAVSVATKINPGALGHTLTFSASISVKGAVVSSAGAWIVEPPAPPPPPPPATQTCPNGTVIPATSVCPAPAPIDPPGSFNNPVVGQSPGVGAPDIPTTDHDVMADLSHDGAVHTPGEGKPDVVGKFRVLCRHTDSRNDDHVVFYQQPGKSHLHDETGVYDWGAYVNYGNLRTGAHGSGCNDVAGADDLNQPVIPNDPKVNHSANRTPYEQPALLDGRGNVINDDVSIFYYSRRPKSDPIVSDPTHAGYMGQAADLPNGIKFIFGNHPEDPAAPFDNTNVKFICTANASGQQVETGSDMLAALKACQGTKGKFEARAQAQDCWDGVNLDSPDHRSHLSYAGYGSWGYLKCDAAHPYVIPSFTLAAQYTIAATDDVTLIHFSSDEAAPGKPAGWSFHADYGPKAWDPLVWAMLRDNCIDKLLSCDSGDLGNGYRLKGGGSTIYPVNGIYRSLGSNPQRLTPIPPMP